MNIGNNILNLRREKNITQEELAAELGVTAAAISKWENNYTLPDILMLCALADYFGVSTDELLGRSAQQRFAAIVTENPTLGAKIQHLAATHGIQTAGIYPTLSEAVEALRANEQITHLLYGQLGTTMPEIDFNMFHGNAGVESRNVEFYLSVSDNEADILEELESCLK